MEIVTWVLQGSLVHQDSTGHNGLIYPGLAQRMSAGTGILHSEKNDSWRLGGEQHTDPVHFVQMWVAPDESGITPGYQQLEIDNELLAGGLVPVASGMAKHDGNAAIRIRNKYAALYAARLRPGPLMSRRSSRNSVASASNLGSAAGRGSGLRNTPRRFYRLCQP
jgi:redox-sensitive bicupin YhaK (pirin superfamily)